MNIDKNVYPHLLRSSMTNNLWDNGADVAYLRTPLKGSSKGE